LPVLVSHSVFSSGNAPFDASTAQPTNKKKAIPFGLLTSRSDAFFCAVLIKRMKAEGIH
jgi:hypothetical protein